VLADADWLASIDSSSYSTFLSLAYNESWTFSARASKALESSLSYRPGSFDAFIDQIPMPRFVDSPLLDGLLLVPSDQAFDKFEARWALLLEFTHCWWAWTTALH
jgi:hypothetical protein